MDNHNILPDEEMNFNLSIDDIVKTTTEATDEPTPQTQEQEEDINLLDVIEDTVESTVEEPIDETEEVSEEVTEQPEETPYSEEVYSAALEFVKENGILNIPDELESVDDDTWQQIIEQNKEDMRNSILQEMRMSADPRITELFDYVYQGGSWDGFDEMKDTIAQEVEIDNLNVEDEQDQRYLIENYLMEGLDPNNPAHQLRIKNIPNEIDSFVERLEAEELANQAKTYFLDKANQQKEAIKQEQARQAQERAAYEQQIQQQQQEWNSQFVDSLKKRSWSQQKKDAVISQFDIVTLDNNQQMEMWEYKWQNMWRNPEAVQVFMDFMSDFDPDTLNFNRNGVPTNKAVTSTIKNLINSKKQNKNKGKHVSGKREASSGQIKTIDPRDY